SLLVAGNLLGIGILALPIKVGLSGYGPSMVDISVICIIMLISAFIIAARLPADKKHFDMPSFFGQELGTSGRWIAVVCNLILLYGVLVAYLSAISTIAVNLLPVNAPHVLITILYFLLVTSLVMFGRNVLKKGNTILLIIVFICFIILVSNGTTDFHAQLLGYKNWALLPLGLPVAVSAFHFHNIIPTVSRHVKHDLKATRKAITIGVAIGLVMNIVWSSIVLGSLTPIVGPDSIFASFVHGLPATVPLTHLLHSKIFTTAGIVFAALAVTASYVANGTGLFGFMRDLTYTYFKTDNRLIIGCLAFLPPLIITLIYPSIFLSAVDIVGGVGETILFIVLPAIILLKSNRKKSRLLSILGYFMLAVGIFIFSYIVLQKFGVINLTAHLGSA
ncbi:MAG: tryptophan/tyrosine permease, partial [Gammaproteobacteria bacterium]|nr:tryptophan/tyrosine permease [Gammaproteobacteria bacterium]